jgi:hypothetical protein
MTEALNNNTIAIQKLVDKIDKENWLWVNL